MSEHGEPDGKDCAICFCEIEPDVYCEYKIHEEEPKWRPSPICYDCICLLQETQWAKFLELVEKVDCRRAALNLCKSVPLYVHDHASFKCTIHTSKSTDTTPDNNDNQKQQQQQQATNPNVPMVDCQDTCPNFGQIEQLWLYDSNEIIVPILNGAKIGEERDEYISNLLEFAMLFEDEREMEIEAMKNATD